jgi:Effector protein
MQQTIVSNILMDGSDIGTVRKDIDQISWESGIKLQINNLVSIPPFESSRAVVGSLANSGHQTVILPVAKADGASTEPIEGIEWAKRRSDYIDATPEDKEPLKCAAEGMTPGRDESGKPLWPGRGKKGSGRGSDVAIYYTPQDYIETKNAPGGRTDEILLHEMVHALRMSKGKSLCVSFGDDYDTQEEFYAILITNIYRSENRYTVLRANHFGHLPLMRPLTDDGAFYQRYKLWIDILVNEWNPLCKSLARVSCAFNPIRRANP